MTTTPLRGHTIPVHNHGFVRLIDWMGTDRDIVEAARVSYNRAGSLPDHAAILKRLNCKTLDEAVVKFLPSKERASDIEVWATLEKIADKKLLNYLFSNKHTSPFEMCQIKFHIKMPIFVARQYVRHRMQSINEVSARYTELPDDFFIPKQWRTNEGVKNKQGSVVADLKLLNPRVVYDAGANDGSTFTTTDISLVVEDFYERAYELYERLLEAKVAREQARIVLPVGIYTEFYARWDLNNLLKYFALRDDPHAQGEHQDYAKAMKQIAALLFPWTMEIYEQRNHP